MTDKEKLDTIRAEIERRIAKRRSEIEKYCGSLIDKEKLQEDLELLSFIDSLEEPKKCMYTNEHYTDEDMKVLCEDCEERCEYSKKEEPVSEFLNTESMIESYKQRLISKANGMKKSPFIDMCLVSYKHGINETLNTLNLSNVERTVKNWKEEPISDDLEEAAWLYYDKNRLPIPPEWDLHKEFIDFFKAGANWQKTKDSTCVSNDLEEAAKEWLIPQLDKSYGAYGERKMMELTRFDGYAMLDAIEFGMKKMKEQMIKNAIEREVKLDSGGYPYVDCNIELYDYTDDKPLAKARDKVKLIVIKEC